MPDDAVVSGLDVKFGTLDFGVEPSGFEINLDSQATSTTSALKNEPKIEYNAPAQPPAASSLPKPDASLGGFSTQQSNQVKSTATSYPYGTSYVQPGVSTTSSQSQTSQPGAYPSQSNAGNHLI